MQEEHPFAFENKKFVRAQLRWPTHEKELFAMVSCFKCWQHYLGSHKTKVFTNNVSLRYFKMQPKATGKQLRWHDILVLMDIKLIHKPNKDNVIPNVLSRKK